jgi:hypothetical protein
VAAVNGKDRQNDAGEAVPVPAAWVYDTHNLYIRGFETQFAPDGYIRLEFNGDQTGGVRAGARQHERVAQRTPGVLESDFLLENSR